MKNFIYGLVHPFRSVSIFIKYPKLILHSIIPVIINFIIYSSVFAFTLYKFSGIAKSLTGIEYAEALWYNYAFYILLLLLSIVLILFICYFAFTILGSIVTGPFNENISQFTEEKILNEKIIYEIGFFKDAYRSITAEIKKLMFYVFFIVPFFLIGFIPVIGSIFSGIMIFIFSVFYTALDFFDYPMQRKNYTLRQKIKSVLSNKSVSAGFGLTGFLLMLLPFLNVFLKPLLVVSGTTIYFEKEYK
ncbi:MAG: EI24 domain-containing protein [Ignavibacteria bacterium]|nr:EI24 domain-containing protein [Ignavibacteria bacterium]